MKSKTLIKIACAIIVMLFFLPRSSRSQSITKEMKVHYSLEVIRYKIPQAQQKEFEKAYTEAGEYLKTSPYCLGYKIVHGDEEPDNYIVFIRWTSADEHLNKFRRGSEFPPFLNLVKPFYNNIQEMKHYNPTAIWWVKE